MNYPIIIAACAILVGLASVAYGLWQAKRASKAFGHGAVVVREREILRGRLQSTERALKRVNERFAEAEAALLAERKAHASTKGQLTRAKNKNPAQGKAAAKKVG